MTEKGSDAQFVEVADIFSVDDGVIAQDEQLAEEEARLQKVEPSDEKEPGAEFPDPVPPDPETDPNPADPLPPPEGGSNE